jgi:DMSO/TMAO reductase YedYZ molybdopterin-dependent catalytic subunit
MANAEPRQVTSAEWRRKSRRSFLTAGALGALGVLGGAWGVTRPEDQELSWPLRAMHRANEKIFRTAYSNSHLGESPTAPVPGTAPRVNGDIGIPAEVDYDAWRLAVTAQPEGGKGDPALAVTYAQLQAMPQTSATCVFKCIEGWSEPMAYQGVRFSDFLAATGVGTRDGKPWLPTTPFANLYPYVGMETPDGAYFVGLDMESLLHPKTVLALEMNGEPISVENGAPVRLMIPVKYGIKNLKCVGRIFFSASRPRDYWAEDGYDWYAAL